MIPPLSPKFLVFLEDYSRRTGKAPATIIEEAVSQAILRHESEQEEAVPLLMPSSVQRELLTFLPGFEPQPADTSLGEFMERLPDRSWTYQAGRHGDWWFLVISLEPSELPEPLELRSVETSQAYAWLFGYTKAVKLWSATDRFLIVF